MPIQPGARANLLQRGRAHVSAEGMSVKIRPAKPPALQRGRAHVSAEGALLLLLLAETRKLSIATTSSVLRAFVIILFALFVITSVF